MCFPGFAEHVAILAPVVTMIVGTLWRIDDEVDCSQLPNIRLVLTYAGGIPALLVALCSAGYI